MTSVFAVEKPSVWKNEFHGQLTVGCLVGGIPTDPKVAEGWLRTKTALSNEQLIQQAIAETMAERGVEADEAIEIVNANKHLNGFKRGEHGLYIEGRQLKAAIKEAANIRWPKAKWGPSNKGTKSFFAEHVFVMEDRLELNVPQPSGVQQRFVHTFRGSGIQYEEYVLNAVFDYTIITDYDFTKTEWAELWLTGEQQGIGATRSQGYGRYEVTRWDKARKKAMAIA